MNNRDRDIEEKVLSDLMDKKQTKEGYVHNEYDIRCMFLSCNNPAAHRVLKPIAHNGQVICQEHRDKLESFETIPL